MAPLRCNFSPTLNATRLTLHIDYLATSSNTTTNRFILIQSHLGSRHCSCNCSTAFYCTSKTRHQILESFSSSVSTCPIETEERTSVPSLLAPIISVPDPLKEETPTCLQPITGDRLISVDYLLSIYSQSVLIIALRISKNNIQL